MGFIADIFGGKDSPPAPKPEPVAKKVVDSSEAKTRAKTRAKKRRARLAGAKGLLSGGFKGYGDKDTLGG